MRARVALAEHFTAFAALPRGTVPRADAEVTATPVRAITSTMLRAAFGQLR